MIQPPAVIKYYNRDNAPSQQVLNRIGKEKFAWCQKESVGETLYAFSTPLPQVLPTTHRSTRPPRIPAVK